MKEKYLPVGTVVTLEGATKRIMIIGYCPMVTEQSNQVYDYSACTFPEGVISSDKTLAFNHTQISAINFMGLEDEEQLEFNKKIKEMMSNLKTLQNISFAETEVASENNVAKSELPTEVQGVDIPVLDVAKPDNNQVNSIEDIMKQQ